MCNQIRWRSCPTTLDLLVAAASQKGSQHECKGKENQDAFFVNPHPNMLSLCALDGMGGYDGGELASRGASAVVSDGIDQLLSERTLARHEDMQDWLKELCARANDRVTEMAAGHPELSQMGTTIVLASFFPDPAPQVQRLLYAVAVMGDSVFCLIRNGREIVTSTAHTVANTWNPVLYKAVGFKGTELSRSLRVGGRDNPDIYIGLLEPGDKIALLTDGVEKYVPVNERLDIFRSWQEPKDLCDELIARALANRSRDDLTAMVINVQSL